MCAATDSITSCADYCNTDRHTDRCLRLVVFETARLSMTSGELDWTWWKGQRNVTHYLPYKRLNFVSARRHFSFIRPSVTVNTLLLLSHTDYCFNYFDRLRNWLTEKWCFENPRDNTKYYISVINLKSDAQCVAKSTVERSCTACSFAKFSKLLQPTTACDDATSSWRSCLHTVFSVSLEAACQENTQHTHVCSGATNKHRILLGHLETGHKEQVRQSWVMATLKRT